LDEGIFVVHSSETDAHGIGAAVPHGADAVALGLGGKRGAVDWRSTGAFKSQYDPGTNVAGAGDLQHPGVSRAAAAKHGPAGLIGDYPLVLPLLSSPLAFLMSLCGEPRLTRLLKFTVALRR